MITYLRNLPLFKIAGSPGPDLLESDCSGTGVELRCQHPGYRDFCDVCAWHALDKLLGLSIYHLQFRVLHCWR